MELVYFLSKRHSGRAACIFELPFSLDHSTCSHLAFEIEAMGPVTRNFLFRVCVLLNFSFSYCAGINTRNSLRRHYHHNNHQQHVHHSVVNRRRHIPAPSCTECGTEEKRGPLLSFEVGFRDIKLDLMPSLKIPDGIEVDDLENAKAINPSVLHHDGKTWLAFRGHMKLNTTWLSSVTFGTFESSGLFLKSHDLLQRLPNAVSRCLLKQSGHFISGPADPRLFHDVDGKLMVSYLYYSSVQTWSDDSQCSELSSYRVSMWVKPVHFEVAPIEIQISEPNFSEKNWLFFRSHGRVYAVYSIEPHVVLHVDIKNGRAAEAFRTSSRQFPRLILPQTSLHLGAGPVRLLDMHAFLFVGHTTHFETRQYMNFLYLTEDVPPFRVRCVQRRPLPLFSDPSHEEKISFASGISVEENVLSVWYGADDKESRVFTTALDSALADMHCDYSGFRDKKYQKIVFQPRTQSGGGLHAPSLVKLPKGSMHPYVAVARAPYSERVTRVNNNDYKLVTSTIWGCVLDKYFNCVRDPLSLKINLPRKAIVARTLRDKQQCARTDLAGSRKIMIGPDNPRLVVRGDDILLFFDMNSAQTHHCSGIWMVNLRAVLPFDWVLPGLESAIVSHSLPTELVWNETELSVGVWSPFFHEELLLLSLSSNPQRILSAGSFDDKGSIPEMEMLLEEHRNLSPATYLDLDLHYRVQLSTQWLKFRLCTKKNCSDDDGFAFVSIVNVQTRDRNMDSSSNFACLHSSEPPFNIENIVPIDHIMFGGHFVLRKIVVSSIGFWDETITQIGFLDSKIIIGFAVGDQDSYALVTSIKELISNSTEAHQRE